MFLNAIRLKISFPWLVVMNETVCMYFIMSRRLYSTWVSFIPFDKLFYFVIVAFGLAVCGHHPFVVYVSTAIKMLFTIRSSAAHHRFPLHIVHVCWCILRAFLLSLFSNLTTKQQRQTWNSNMYSVSAKAMCAPVHTHNISEVEIAWQRIEKKEFSLFSVLINTCLILVYRSRILN